MKKNIIIIASIVLIVPLIYNFKAISNHCGLGQICSSVINQLKPTQQANPTLDSTPSINGQHPLALQLYQAQNQKNPDQFISIVRQASALPKNEFIQFLHTRHPKVGWTTLMIAGITGDNVQFTALFEAMKKVFHNDPQSAFDYMDMRTKRGFTAFQLSAYLGNMSSFKPFVDYTIALLKSDTMLLFKTIDSSNDWQTSPLSTLAYDSSTDAMMYLVQQAEEQFGRGSKLFHNFLNSKDIGNLTALDYTNVPREQILLIQNGAIKSTDASSEIQKARKMANQLVNAMYSNDLPKIIAILNAADQQFNEDNFGLFLASKDSEGWTPLMHPVGLGLVKIHKIFLHAASSKFKEDPFQMFDVMSYTTVNGFTPFSLAVSRRYFEIASYILETGLQLNINKYWFFSLMGAQSILRGFNVLTNAIYNSSDQGIYLDFIKLLLDKVSGIYGKNSRPFYLFINQLDNNNFTALDYADTPKMQKLLKSFGAQMGNVVHKRYKQELKQAKSI